MYRYNRRDVLLAVGMGLSLFFWASAFSGIRFALSEYTPAEIGALRFVVASLALLGVSFFKGLPRLRVVDLPAIVTTGVLGVTLHQLFLNTGELTVSAGAASMVASLLPVFTAVLAALFLGEHLPLQAWLGVGICMLGATLIALGDAHGVVFDLGILLVLGAALARAGSFILQKRLMVHYGALGVTTYTVWVATAALLFFAPELASSMREASPYTTAAVVYLGLFPAAFGYLVWGYVLQRMPAAKASSLLFLVPVMAVGVAWVWLGEVPTLMTLVGGMLSLAGLTWVQTREPGLRIWGRRLYRITRECCRAATNVKVIPVTRGR